jgi:sulfur carrier protein ThiS adenylyltransferase
VTETIKTDSLFARNVPGTWEILSRKTVGLAGCGGTGSNAAVALARAGIGRLILADCDIIAPSNLNRQYYFLEDVGKAKAETLAHRLKQINPRLRVEAHLVEVTPANVYDLFKEADILIEAFDRAESKQWLIETWCRRFPHRPIVCGSGLSGWGRTGSLKVRRSGQIVVCGDETTDMSMGLISARVAIVANMQANEAIALLLGQNKETI